MRTRVCLLHTHTNTLSLLDCLLAGSVLGRPTLSLLMKQRVDPDVLYSRLQEFDADFVNATLSVKIPQMCISPVQIDDELLRRVTGM
ncbi:hypothetical protein CDAR_375801 [Caerostris darwini]|uniref:Uncharacterized protein n=1 Tax=Caerostris darwini TaxID=1538125 RepID=A0AAV4S3L1_9ARAC|nr:hypothetical protein CDAR_375801 [Caerostris darwini]